MIPKDSIEEAYCFFHQKWRIYKFSSIATQRDDIEYSISSYAASMNHELYNKLSDGKDDFLHTHATFSEDLSKAVDSLEGMM